MHTHLVSKLATFILPCGRGVRKELSKHVKTNKLLKVKTVNSAHDVVANQDLPRAWPWLSRAASRTQTRAGTKNRAQYPDEPHAQQKNFAQAFARCGHIHSIVVMSSVMDPFEDGSALHGSTQNLVFKDVSSIFRMGTTILSHPASGASDETPWAS